MSADRRINRSDTIYPSIRLGVRIYPSIIIYLLYTLPASSKIQMYHISESDILNTGAWDPQEYEEEFEDYSGSEAQHGTAWRHVGGVAASSTLPPEGHRFVSEFFGFHDLSPLWNPMDPHGSPWTSLNDVLLKFCWYLKDRSLSL